MRVILSARAAWAVANDAAVVENVGTTYMMVRKSRVEIVICCGGGTEVLAAAPSGGAVLGHGALKRQRAVELMALEPKGEKPVLRVPEPKAPQNAPLEGAAPQQKYIQLAGPRLEGEQSGAEAATGRWSGWLQSHDGAPI